MSTEPSSTAWPCLHVTRQGLVLDVIVAPNAKRTACMGLHDGALRIRLAAAPVDGAANEALLRWVAMELSIARQSVSLLRGDSSKRKQVLLAGVTPTEAGEWLARAAAGR